MGIVRKTLLFFISFISFSVIFGGHQNTSDFGHWYKPAWTPVWILFDSLWRPENWKKENDTKRAFFCCFFILIFNKWILWILWILFLIIILETNTFMFFKLINFLYFFLFYILFLASAPGPPIFFGYPGIQVSRVSMPPDVHHSRLESPKKKHTTKKF